MLKGTIVNAAAVLAGSGVGYFIKKSMPSKYQKTIMHGLALSIALIGIQMSLKTHNMLIVIISMVFGAVLGEMLDIDMRLTKFGEMIAKKIGQEGTSFGEGFVTASLVFCVGAMAIIGSIQEGLTGDASTLYAKAMLDAVSSVIFSSSMGIGVGLSSVSILIYQGSITLLAGCFSSMLSETVIAEITAVGGLLIIGISLLMLDIIKIKIANLLPAIPVAVAVAIFWPK